MDALLFVHDMHHRRGRHAAHSHASHTMFQRAPFCSHTPTALLKRHVLAYRLASRDHCHHLHNLAARGSSAQMHRQQHVGYQVARTYGCAGGPILNHCYRRAHPTQRGLMNAPSPSLPCARRLECLLRKNRGTHCERMARGIRMGVGMGSTATSALLPV